ncbi:uncharacterized protein TNCV_505491 [Trichonephila clavipes]|nr:uncharacterized protein TNCV_505491 [Trichonephila clavipes]
MLESLGQIWKQRFLISSTYRGTKPERAPVPVLFDDNIALWTSNVDIKELEHRLNDSLLALSNFASNLKLIQNPTKSIATFFFTNKHQYDYQPKLILEGQQLIYEKNPKYLGFVIDPEFSSNKRTER